jgi:hypothetical protein
MTQPDVLYIHGYEGSAHGTKGNWLRNQFSFFGVDMPEAKTKNPLGKQAPIEDVLAEIRSAIIPSASFMKKHILEQNPKVIVASSFGTAVWLTLVLEEGFRIPSVILAPACSFLGVGDSFPHDMRTIIIHGTKDTLIPIQHAKQLHKKSGPHSLYWPVEDEHSLPLLTTKFDELRMAVQKLLWEQGSDSEKQRAQSIAIPF